MLSDASPIFAVPVASGGEVLRVSRVHMFTATTNIALLFYDYLLTFSTELKVIWGREFSGVTVLFILVRYSALISKPLLFARHILALYYEEVGPVRAPRR